MNKIKCEICNKLFKGLAGHLKAKHNISTLDYKLKYPGALTLSENFYNQIKLKNANNIRNCECCGSSFNFTNNKKKRFCTQKCKYLHIKTNFNKSGIKTSKKYVVFNCEYCGLKNEKLSYRANKLFCNKECYNNYHKVDKIENKCKYNNCNNIIIMTKKLTKKYCSRECYKLDFNEDRINFNTHSKYKKGYYISIKDNKKKWYDSSYELSRMKQLDIDDNVKEWGKNTIKIKYIGEDQKEHIYTPDLFIKYNNGIEVIEEIKGRMTKKDILKMEAAIPFLKSMNLQYKILQKNNIYDDYIEPIIEEYTNKFGTFQRISLLYTFMKMSKSVSNRSTCVRKHVGCLIVQNNLENIVSIGYNGSSPGEENGCKELIKGKCGCIHAEINALKKIHNNNNNDLILLCTLSPCVACSKEILKYPIKKVIYLDNFRDTSGVTFLRNNGVDVIKYEYLVNNSNNRYKND